MIKIIGGDFGENKYANLHTTFGGKFKSIGVSTGFFRYRNICREDIASVQIIDDTNKASVSGAVGGGIVGSLLAGSIGLLAGSLLGGRDKGHILLIRCCDGKQLLCAVNSRDYQLILGAAVGKLRCGSLEEPINPPSLPPTTVGPLPSPPTKSFQEKAKDAVADFASNSKAATMIVAKQAERLKISRITLPNAYWALGKDIYAAGRYRDEFAGFYANVDEILGRIQKFRQPQLAPSDQPQKFIDRAKAVAEHASDLVKAMAMELKVNSLFRELGKKVFEKNQESSGLAPLIEPIAHCLTRLEQLGADIRQISESRAGGFLTPPRLLVGGAVAIPVIGLLLIVCLFPGGASLNDDAKYETINDDAKYEAMVMAEQIVKMHLRYPDDAEFIGGQNAILTSQADRCQYWTIHGKVKSANGFGAKLTIPYAVLLDHYIDGGWRTESVIIDGKEVY